MTKQELGKQIETLRKECGVSTYDLEKKGIHPALPSTIEKGKKGYTMDSLLNYLNAIDEDIFLRVGKMSKKKLNTKSVQMKTLIDKQAMIKTYYDALSDKVYNFQVSNRGESPEGIIMNYNTWSDMAHYPLIPVQHEQGDVPVFMGIKVIRTYDIEEGEFLIF